MSGFSHVGGMGDRASPVFLASPASVSASLVQWAWTYLTGQRGDRLIVNYEAAASHDAPSVPQLWKTANPRAAASRLAMLNAATMQHSREARHAG